MRHSRRLSYSLPQLFKQALFSAMALLFALHLAACATTPPAKLEVSDVLEAPETHESQRVELVGEVIHYEPARGDTYRTLYFTLGTEPDQKLGVFAAGYTAEAIAKASTLVEEAFEANLPLKVVGRLKVDDDVEPPVAELRLESVEYQGRKVVVTRGKKTRPGFEVGGIVISPSIGIGAVITP